MFGKYFSYIIMKITSKMSTESEPRIQTREPHLQLISVKQPASSGPPPSRSYSSLEHTVLLAFLQVVQKDTIHIMIMETANMHY